MRNDLHPQNVLHLPIYLSQSFSMIFLIYLSDGLEISARLKIHPTTQKMKFSIKVFFSKCYQIHSFLRIWSNLLKKSLMENFIFCAVPIQIKNREYNERKTEPAR